MLSDGTVSRIQLGHQSAVRGVVRTRWLRTFVRQDESPTAAVRSSFGTNGVRVEAGGSGPERAKKSF